MAKIEIRLDDAIIDGKISFNPRQIAKWREIYGIVGHHSAIEICSWTKKALLGKGTCYKHKFYGIDTHRCAQISPAAAWCQEACIFCWRPMEWYSRTKMDKELVDSPEEIINGVVEVRRKLLSGFGGNKNVNRKLFDEAYNLFPSHWAISLSGEPTIYPRLGELISLLRKRKEVRSIFVVSNGQEPDVFLSWKREELPTQLYISLSAPTKELFNEVNRSVYRDGWERLMKTLHEVLPRLKTRRVVRFTLIKGINDKPEFASLYGDILEATHADYIEVKAYMYLGQSRKRLKKENMPSFEYVKSYALSLLKHLPSYAYHNDHPPSRIVLLKRKDSPYFDHIISSNPDDSLKERGLSHDRNNPEDI